MSKPVFKSCLNCDPHTMGFWRRVRLALLIILKQRFLLGWWCKPEGWKTIKLMSEKEYDALPKILEWYDD